MSDYNGGTTEKVFTVTDAFLNGVKGYRRLHTELVDDKKIVSKDSNALERTVMSHVEKTNDRVYITAVRDHLTKLKTVLNDVGPRLKKFSDYVTNIENLLQYRQLLETFKKDLNAFKLQSQSHSAQKPKDARATLQNKTALDNALKKETLQVIEEATEKKEDGVETRTKWLDVWNSIKSRYNSTKKTNNNDWIDGFLNDSESDFITISNILNSASSFIDTKLSDIPDSYKKNDKRARKSSSELCSLNMYMEWYNMNDSAVPDRMRISEDTAASIDVLKIGYIYRADDNPLRAFRQYMQTQQSELLNFVQKSPNDEKNIPTQLINTLVSEITKLTSTVNNTLDVNEDQGVEKAILAQMNAVITAGQRLSDRQAAHLQSIGKVPRLAEASEDSKDAAVSGAASSSPASKSSDNSFYGSMKSSIFGPSGGAGDKVSDDRRKLDAVLAQEAPRYLRREIKEHAIRTYISQVKGFTAHIKSTSPLDRLVDTVLKNADSNLAATDQDIRTIKQTKTDPDSRRFQTDAEGGRKKEIMLRSLSNMKSQTEEYRRLHEDFLFRDHRDGHRYLMYWRNIRVENEGARKAIQEYFEALKALMHTMEDQVHQARGQYQKALNGGSDDLTSLANWSEHVSADDFDEVMTKIRNFNDYYDDVRREVITMYQGGGRPLSNLITAAPFLIMYVVKMLRVLFAWAALHFSEHLFQLWYAQAVYGRNSDPPDPLVMIGLFLGIDMAMNVALMATLFLLRSLFATEGGNFPVDDTFLKAYVVDYLCVTLAVFVIAAVLAQVIKTKKYFRYRYEGDRGIRALQTMTFYVVIIMLLLPFFRLVQ